MFVGNGINLNTFLKKWRNNGQPEKQGGKKAPKSSNVKAMMYDDEVETLTIQFRDRSIYTYFNVSFNLFNKIVKGRAKCITKGKNKYGRWYVGKTPSQGAAVHKRLINAGITYTKGGSLA